MRTFSFVVLAFASTVGGAQSPPAAAPIELQVIDGQNRVLGPVLQLAGPEDSAVVALDVDGHRIAAYVRPTEIGSSVLSEPRFVYFSASGCVGAGYAVWRPERITDPQAIVGPAFSIYAGPRATGQTLLVQSFLGPGDACQDFGAPTGIDDLVPVTLVRDLAPEFVAPFSLGGAPVPASAVPTLETAGLATLAATLAFVAWVRLRRRNPREQKLKIEEIRFR